MNGMVFVKSIPATDKCDVFIVISDKKIVKFICDNNEASIIDSVRRLKLNVSTAPRIELVAKLPEGASVSSTGSLSPSSLEELIKSCALDYHTARTQVEIQADYDATFRDDSLVEKEPHVWGNKNDEKRKALRAEYICTLPKNQQLAIWLHGELCKHNHTDGCGWFYEVKGLIDDWSGHEHKMYLQKADNALAAANNNIDMVKNIVTAVNRYYL